MVMNLKIHPPSQPLPGAYTMLCSALLFFALLLPWELPWSWVHTVNVLNLELVSMKRVGRGDEGWENEDEDEDTIFTSKITVRRRIRRVDVGSA